MYNQAQDPATPPTTLDRLAGDTDWMVRRAVAYNLATPPATLDRLAGDEEWDVRLAVARNPATPAATLDQLAGDADSSVRLAVARNPETPGNIILAHCGKYALVLSRDGSYYAGCRGPLSLAKALRHWGPPRDDARAKLFYGVLAEQ
jgi:Leucine rich repeat variant